MRRTTPSARPPRLEPRRDGQTVLALLFWIVGITLLLGPFLKEQASADEEGDDPARLLSELDTPFESAVAQFEQEFELDLGNSIREASAEWFGMGSDRLRESGLFLEARLDPGQFAYGRFCIGCHGSRGDGAGPGAQHLSPRPRNFRHSIFKFTSTASGTPPLRKDIFQTITRGLAGSSMPEFRLISEERRWDLVEYVRYLAIRGWYEEMLLADAEDYEELPDPESVAEIVLERWSEEKVKAVYPPVSEIPRTAESIARGRELFTSSGGANCASCHGDDGKGGGPASGDFKDAWGYPIVPRDLTLGVFRAGSAPDDLYRSISTGVGGTPMPSYDGAIPAEDIWSLVHFIQSLEEQQ